MLEGFVNQFATMSLGEELHTALFTVFFVGGGFYCGMRCLRPETPPVAATPFPRQRAPKLIAKRSTLQ
jgi:hypothetical protein